MLAELTKKSLAVVWWTSLAGLALLFGAYAVVSDYMGCVSALERLNYEQRELVYDKLVGAALSSVIPGATIVQTYALLIVVVKMLFLIIGCHLVTSLFQLLRHRLEWRDDPRESQFATASIIERLAWTLLFSVPAGILMYWDFQLFRYRAIADSLNLGGQDAADAVLHVPSWDIYLEQNKHLFAAHLAGTSALGYAAVAIVCCLGLEYCLQQAKEAFTWAMNRIENAVTGGDRQDQELPYDEYDEMAYVETPLESYAEANDEQETEAQPGIQYEVATPVAFENTNMPNEGDEEVRKEVIGAPRGTRITLSEALANKHLYHVDMATGEIYDASYWERLHTAAA